MSPKELEKHKLNYIDINEGLVNEDVDVGGGNGKKALWIYNDKIYILKRQEKNKKIKNKTKYKSLNRERIGDLSYNNSVLSEYIASNIVNFLEFKNINAHNTFLIKQETQDKTRFWVACEHLTENLDKNIFALPSLKTLSSNKPFRNNPIINQEIFSRQHHPIDFYEMVDWIWTQNKYSNKEYLLDFFYNMFVIDAFLLNWDRNHTNWGFITWTDPKTKQQEIEIAPLIDFGSSLFAKQDEKDLIGITGEISNEQIYDTILNSKSFYLKENSVDKTDKIIYHDFFKTTNDEKMINTLIMFLENDKLNYLDRLIMNLNIPNVMKSSYIRLLNISKELLIESLLENELYHKMYNSQNNKKENNNKNIISR